MIQSHCLYAQVPLLVGTTSAKALLALKDTRHHEAALAGNGADAGGAADGASLAHEPVTLRWRNVSAMLTTKKGDTKELLSLAGASARPGRYNSTLSHRFKDLHPHSIADNGSKARDIRELLPLA